MSYYYYFVFKNIDSSCGQVKEMVFSMENPSKNSLKRKVKNIIDNSKEVGMNLTLLEAFPATESMTQNQPRLSRHTKNEHLYKYEVIMGNIHGDDIIKDTIYECSTAPANLVLNVFLRYNLNALFVQKIWGCAAFIDTL